MTKALAKFHPRSSSGSAVRRGHTDTQTDTHTHTHTDSRLYLWEFAELSALSRQYALLGAHDELQRPAMITSLGN